MRWVASPVKGQFVRSLLAGVLACLVPGGCAAPAHKGLTFSTWGSIDEIETLKPLLAEFETANPDVPVDLIHIPDEYPHKVRLMAAARRMPDVLFMENQTLPGFARRGVLRDLAPFLAKDTALKSTDFFKPTLTALTWHNTLYAIPRDLSNIVIFYNRKLFDEAHVPYPTAGWRYEDMVQKARRLTRGDEQFGMGFAPFPIYWLPYLWSDGADMVDATESRCTLLDPPALAALHRYLDLRTLYHCAPTEAQVGNARMSQLFAQGKLAMLVGGRWVVPGFRKKLTFPWDVAAFPAGRAGSIVDADASGWAISSACKDPERAWRLIRFLAGRHACEAFTQSGLIVPARRDVADSPAFLGGGAPANSRVFLDAVSTARPTRTPPSYDEIVYELIDGMEPAWNGERSLEDTLRPVVKRIDALLREDKR
jgi:multiple sugar transport system substrate-binding protein